jgi:rRNA maturation endonuclease Nob1
LGKLSDTDYQSTKKDLQKDLAGVLAEVDKIKAELNGAGMPAAVKSAKTKPTAYVCDDCGAKFDKPLKFCGECGKPMKVAK